jgi:hypothetical protein
MFKTLVKEFFFLNILHKSTVEASISTARAFRKNIKQSKFAGGVGNVAVG